MQRRRRKKKIESVLIDKREKVAGSSHVYQSIINELVHLFFCIWSSKYDSYQALLFDYLFSFLCFKLPEVSYYV